MPLRYVAPFTSKLVDDDGKQITELLWGDPVHVTGSQVDGMIKARARARPRKPETGPRPWGWIAAADLMTSSPILELYVIDVGQGDSVLVRTPDDCWHLVDAGVAAADQMTKKGAANFLRWKFLEDLEQDTVALETIVLSHPDEDHWGGLRDVFSGTVPLRDPFPVAIRRFFHSGIANFKGADPVGASIEGEVPPFPIGGQGLRTKGRFITELLTGKGSFANPPRPLATEFAHLAAAVAQVPETVQRLSRDDAFLPGYALGNASGAVIHVLGPLMETLTDGRRGFRVLGKPGETKNGHSVVLRIDYGAARLLLTGDLNDASQRLLLSYVPSSEFSVDVAKACHHGAERVELSFLEAMQARATVISSGDNETHAHPRPALMGASARYGREGIDVDGKRMPPLVYSTELARSVALCFASGVRAKLVANSDEEKQVPVDRIAVRPSGTNRPYRHLPGLPLAADLVYGLVNVRTDGTHILCATMEESGSSFDVKIFRAGT